MYVMDSRHLWALPASSLVWEPHAQRWGVIEIHLSSLIENYRTTPGPYVDFLLL